MRKFWDISANEQIHHKETYSVDFQSCDMIKRGKNFPTLIAPVISPTNNCTAEKQKDVLKLVQTLGIVDNPFYEAFKSSLPFVTSKKVNEAQIIEDEETAIINEDLF